MAEDTLAVQSKPNAAALRRRGMTPPRALAAHGVENVVAAHGVDNGVAAHGVETGRAAHGRAPGP